MLSVVTLKDLTPAHVKLDIQEVEKAALVSFLFSKKCLQKVVSCSLNKRKNQLFISCSDQIELLEKGQNETTVFDGTRA